jgi:hypothetical protein
MTHLQPLAALKGAVLVLVWMAQYAYAHIDAPRTPLSQLFLAADFAAIVRIDTVEKRRFVDGENIATYEVVTATTSSHYKGEQHDRIEFFQYAHGHADFQPGDTAVLFLQVLNEQHQLYKIGSTGSIHYVSHQVRNTEHRLKPADLVDYRWVLQAYANPPVAGNTDAAQQRLRQIMLRMLQSDSPKLTESALLDQLLRQIRDPLKPIGLRLALLREMSRRGLADQGEWKYLLESESDENLLLVLKSMEGYENREFMAPLVALLVHPSSSLVEGAARALGHPVYAGAETSLKPLLESENQRLNYAAVSGLIGINSPRARAILSEAAGNHPNAKVRRMISARLSLLA